MRRQGSLGPSQVHYGGSASAGAHFAPSSGVHKASPGVTPLQPPSALASDDGGERCELAACGYRNGAIGGKNVNKAQFRLFRYTP